MEITNAGIECMEEYGGSFVKALANAWYKADPVNRRILENNFPYFEEYENQAERRNTTQRIDPVVMKHNLSENEVKKFKKHQEEIQ